MRTFSKLKELYTATVIFRRQQQYALHLSYSLVAPYQIVYVDYH
jgi:hypothetical protein